MLRTIFCLSSAVITSLMTLTSIAIKPAQANAFTDDGYIICNYTQVRHDFTLIDLDYDEIKNYSLDPGECLDFWEFEQVSFYNNFDVLKNYNLYEDNVYSFEFRSNGVVDFFHN